MRKIANFAVELTSVGSDILVNKEALCFSRSRERRKFKTYPRVGIVVLTRIAWAAIPTSLDKGYSYDLRLMTWHSWLTFLLYFEDLESTSSLQTNHIT